jgi:hypothetical protein
MKHRVMKLAFACVILGIGTAAFAVPPNQVLRSTDLLRFVGPCCVSFDQSVQVIEAAKPSAVVVTWTMDYLADDYILVGLMVNGGPCTFYGSGSIPFNTRGTSRTFQWIVFPNDGLRAGTNTFTVCGGGAFGLERTLVINAFVGSASTLAVRLSN